MIRFEIAKDLTAFGSSVVGTKVLDREQFLAAAARAVSALKPRDYTCGTALVQCPEAIQFVSSWIGRRSAEAADYVQIGAARKVRLYLRRELAADVIGVELGIETREAYIADLKRRSARNRQEAARVQKTDATHVIASVWTETEATRELLPMGRICFLLGWREASTLPESWAHHRAEVDKLRKEWVPVADPE